MVWSDVYDDLCGSIDGLCIAYDKLADCADFAEGTVVGDGILKLLNQIDEMETTIKRLEREALKLREV